MSQHQQNLQHQDKTQDKYIVSCKIEKFMICVDPDSKQIYGLNPQTNEVYIFTDDKSQEKIDYTLDHVQLEEINNVHYLNKLKEDHLISTKESLSSISYDRNSKTFINNNGNQLQIQQQQSQQQNQQPSQQQQQQQNQQLQQQLENGQNNNNNNNNVQNIQKLLDKDVYTIYDYRRKGLDAINNIEEIIHLNKGNWLIQHERADQYRRRKLPNYLLQRTDQNHPTYICQSPLSEVFVDKKTIEIVVNLSKFEKQIVGKNKNIDIKNFKLDVGLVTAADEVLKNILRKVYKDSKVKLQPAENHTFILKIEGYREYLIGHYPMLSYDRVRTNLRGNKPLNLVLDQKQNQIDNQKQFPPDFERLVVTINYNKNECKQQFLQKSEKSITEVQNLLKFVFKDVIFRGGKMQQLYLSNNYKIIDNTNHIIHQDQFNINWKDYKDIPALLWYAPQKLPRYNPNQDIDDLVLKQQEYQNDLRNSNAEFNAYKMKYYKIYKDTRGFLFSSEQDRFMTMADDESQANPINTQTEEENLKNSNHTSQTEQRKGSVMDKIAQQILMNNDEEEEEEEEENDEAIIQKGKDLLQKTYQDFYKLKTIQCKIDPNRFLRGCEQAEKFAKQFLGEGQQNDLKLRVIHKERMKELVEKRRNLMAQKIFSEKPTNLYSGECDWMFKIKIKGIENLYRIFEQADVNLEDTSRATYNGILPPNYITKQGEWRKALEHEEKIQIPQRIDGNPQPVLRLSKVNPQKFEEKPVSKKEHHNNANEQQQQSGINHQGTKNRFDFPQRNEFDASGRGAQKNAVQNSLPPNFSLKFSTDHGDKGCDFFKQLQRYYDINFPPYLIQIQVKLMYGNRALSYKKETQKIPFCRSPRWDEWIKFPLIKISQLPLESRISFDVIVYSNTGLESQTIGSTTFYVFDQYSKFAQGISPLNLWPFYASDDRLACQGQYFGLQKSIDAIDQRDFYAWEQFKANEYSRLFIELDTFQKHMYWSLRDDKTMIQLEFQNAKNRLEDLWVYTPQNQYLAELKELLSKDPINRQFDMRQKLILLICRNHFKSIHQALDIFLCAVDWSNPEHIRETYSLLKQWKSPPSEECITFLDAHHADEVIRLYGVERISKMADDEIKLYMIELIQSLLFENNHYSPIQELLLERSLLNPFVVGHELFWSLKSQLHLKASYERYALFLEQLLMVSGEYRTELLKEVKVNEDIKKVARNIKKSKTNEQAKEILSLELQKLQNRYQKQKIEDFTLAIDNRLQLNEFILNKCKFMNSKKKPLWLVMNNKENEMAFSIMFKDGDDLRQDILTLQLIRIMDKIWLDNNLDLRMKPYNVVATQDQVGMLEIVGNSMTTAGIHKLNSKRFGCIYKESIQKYLQENNPGEKYQLARENFRSSCAGYCVATYILGIGDRHSDNIMITKEGHFFHIDFGHFLGNFKKKFGINRERSPFVFTRVMEYVMIDGNTDDYQIFENMCFKAYNLIRKHGNFFINIFRMMLSAGMPELQKESDIEYLVETLQLNLSDNEAEQHFKKQIRIARSDLFKIFDNFIHEIVKN